MGAYFGDHERTKGEDIVIVLTPSEEADPSAWPLAAYAENVDDSTDFVATADIDITATSASITLEIPRAVSLDMTEGARYRVQLWREDVPDQNLSEGTVTITKSIRR